MVSNPGYDMVPNGGLILLAGNGDGTLGEPAYIPIAADRLVTGDFDGNGTLDVATFTDQTARVALGRGDGSFDEAVDYGIFSRSALAADLDGDGAIDLVGTEGSAFTVMLGKGDGSFHSPYLGDSLSVLAATDFNGDGRPDLVAWRSGMLYTFVQAVPTASTVSK